MKNTPSKPTSGSHPPPPLGSPLPSQPTSLVGKNPFEILSSTLIPSDLIITSSPIHTLLSSPIPILLGSPPQPDKPLLLNSDRILTRNQTKETPQNIENTKKFGRRLNKEIRDEEVAKDISLGTQQGLENFLEKGPKNKEKVQQANKGRGSYNNPK